MREIARHRNSAFISMVRKHARAWLPGLIAVAVLLLVYSGTLQRDVNGSGDHYMIDVGEVQVALNLWGTIHYTGYPLFTILGAALTHALRAIGFSPAAAASAVATGWSLLGLAGAYRLISRVTGGAYELAALTTLALGLVETFWIHSVVAEVYSFSVFLTSATLLVGIKAAPLPSTGEGAAPLPSTGEGAAPLPSTGEGLADRWDERLWWLAMLLLGAGVQHHRMLVLLAPGVLLPAAPALWQRRSGWLRLAVRSALAFALPFLTYAYLPLRARQGAIWVYDQPDTWEGFWTEFTGRAVTPLLMKWPDNAQAWIGNVRFLGDQLGQQLPLLVLLAGAAGLVWLTWRRSLWTGLGLLGTRGRMGAHSAHAEHPTADAGDRRPVAPPGTGGAASAMGGLGRAAAALAVAVPH
jgi:hypothetical protein